MYVTLSVETQTREQKTPRSGGSGLTGDPAASETDVAQWRGRDVFPPNLFFAFLPHVLSGRD